MEALLNVPDPADDPALADWCAALRQTIQPYARTAQGLRGWTPDQRKRLQSCFHAFTADRDERLAMGNYLLLASGLTRAPLKSFNEISEAQASGMITVFYGPDESSTLLLEDSYRMLGMVRDRVRWKRLSHVD